MGISLMCPSCCQSRLDLLENILILPGTVPCVQVHMSPNLKSKKNYLGLAWWGSSKEFSCKSRERGFDLWSRKIPHAAEQSPHVITTKSTL